ncbi:MAG: GNAT family N-acetyltransferase [Ekhidna sp.]
MIEIVDFRPVYSIFFREVNFAWIKNHFEIEESDREMLEDPQNHILRNGGAILIALLDGSPVGTCALIKMDDSTFELAKMAVSEQAQGQKIGWKIGLATIEKAKELGAKKIYLESNSVLAPAINLYRKLGFKDDSGYDSPYSRCNVQMTLDL